MWSKRSNWISTSYPFCRPVPFALQSNLLRLTLHYIWIIKQHSNTNNLAARSLASWVWIPFERVTCVLLLPVVTGLAVGRQLVRKSYQCRKRSKKPGRKRNSEKSSFSGLSSLKHIHQWNTRLSKNSNVDYWRYCQIQRCVISAYLTVNYYSFFR